MGNNVNVKNTPGFGIPEYDFTALTYVGTTNNLDSVTYRLGGASGTTVGVLAFTYVGGTPSANDALVATVTRTT